MTFTRLTQALLVLPTTVVALGLLSTFVLSSTYGARVSTSIAVLTIAIACLASTVGLVSASNVLRRKPAARNLPSIIYVVVGAIPVVLVVAIVAAKLASGA